MKLAPIVVRDRVRGLQKLPWKMIGPTFGSIRFEHRDLGTVTLIARLPDRPGTCCSFADGPSGRIFDRVAATMPEAAAGAYAAFRAAAGDVADNGGNVVAMIPPDAMKTIGELRKLGRKGRFPGVRIAAGQACATDGGSAFIADVAGLTAAGPCVLPPEGLAVFDGGAVRSTVAGQLWLGDWIGDRPDRPYPDIPKLFSAAPEPGGWSAEVDGAEMLSALKTAGTENVGLAVDAGRVVVDGGDAGRVVVGARGAGDPTFAARYNADRLREAIRFVGAKGPVRIRLEVCGRARIEGADPSRYAVVCHVTERKPVTAKAGK